MTPERKVKNAVKKILDKYGAYYCYPATHGYGASGVPDILACLKGHFIAIECKAKGNTTTALQDANLFRIRNTGGAAFVIDEHNQQELDSYLGAL